MRLLSVGFQTAPSDNAANPVNPRRSIEGIDHDASIDGVKDPEQELADLLARREAVKAQIAEKTKRLKAMERERREAINRRIRRAKYRLTAAERKRRTRRLVLMGSMVEARMKKSPSIDAVVRKDLDEFLTRDQDRELFDLEPLGDSEGTIRR